MTSQDETLSPDLVEYAKTFSVPAFWANRFWLEAQSESPEHPPVVMRISFGEACLPHVPVVYRFAVTISAHEAVVLARSILSGLAPALLVETPKAN